MSLFAEIEIEDTLEVQEDRVSGNYAKFETTGHYVCEIEKAYAGTSTGGAFSVSLTLKREDGAKLNITEYISSGTAKGCKNYYIDKNNNKQYLPGYNKIKNLDSLLGFNRAYPDTEKGNVMLWDRDLSKEIPQRKDVISQWLGKKIGILVKKVIEDKYSNPTESREFFEVDHFVEAASAKTRNEIVAGTSGFKDKWCKSFDSEFVNDKRKLSKLGNSNIDVTMDNESPF